MSDSVAFDKEGVLRQVDHRLIVKGIRIKLLNLCMWEPLQKAAHLIFSKAQACYRARLLIELGPYPMRNSKAAASLLQNTLRGGGKNHIIRTVLASLKGLDILHMGIPKSF